MPAYAAARIPRPLLAGRRRYQLPPRSCRSAEFGYGLEQPNGLLAIQFNSPSVKLHLLNEVAISVPPNKLSSTLIKYRRVVLV